MEEKLALFERRWLFVVLVLVALGLRIVATIQVGLEVDEPINYTAARFISRVGYPAIRGELDDVARAYHFHPFFGFYVIWGWMQVFGTGVVQARILSAILSTVAITLISVFIRRTVDRTSGTMALMLLGTDGWMIITNAMVYLENLQMVLIVIGVIAYYRAVSGEKEYPWRYFWAGVAAGVPFIYKHIGVYLLIGIAAHWLLVRRHRQGHLILFFVVALITVAYCWAMYFRWQGEWLEPTLVQLRRTLGLRPSRGLNYGLNRVVEVIVERYWIFPVTILGLILGSVSAGGLYAGKLLSPYRHNTSLITGTAWALLVGGLIIGILINNQFVMIGGAVAGLVIRATPTISNYLERVTLNATTWVIVSWCVGGIAFAAGAALRSPHYFMLWQLPFLSLLGIGLGMLAHRRLAMVVVVVVLMLNAATFVTRVIESRGDALERSADFINENLPPEALIGTEPYIGVLIEQRYVRTDQSTPESLLAFNVTHLGLYRSTTADIPRVIGGRQAVQEYCETVMVFHGFKDTVEVCEINQAALRDYVEQWREEPFPEGTNIPPP